MEERCLFEKLYLCSEKEPLSHASTERIIRSSKQCEDDLHIELEKLQERSNIESVPVHQKCVTGIATRGLFRKLCVKRHKVQVLKMLWPNLRVQGDQNSMTQVRQWYN